MKIILIVAAIPLIALGAVCLSRLHLQMSIADSPPPAAQAETESPFACDIQALTPELRKRHFDELGPKLRSLKRSVQELADGYEFEFPADPATFQLLTEWAIQERQCCPFFDINIRLDREGGPMWLRLSGREGTKVFIKVDGAQWIQQ